MTNEPLTVSTDLAVSENSTAMRLQELHRPPESRSFGQMPADLPLKLLLITFAGFVNRDQSRLIAYLLEENRVALVHESQGCSRRQPIWVFPTP
jgi:hypothetical protein